MYRKLTITNFRGFSSIELNGLSRVNLLVGKNNAGKTSLLEAVELLAFGGRPSSLLRAPRRRGEVSPEPREDRASRIDLDLSHLFRGHRVSDGCSFSIAAHTDAEPEILECTVSEAMPAEQELELFPEDGDLSPPLNIAIKGPANVEGATFNISRFGMVADRAFVVNHAFPTTGPSNAPRPVAFLGTEGVDVWTLQQAWDALVLTPEEESVLSAIRIVEPTLDRIAFTGSGPRSATAAFVKLQNVDQRVPLGSFGEGTKRLLSIAIYASRARGGLLLIDEIDTGLHHSTLEPLWKFIIQAATSLNMQVFATSHSGDCVRSLAWLADDEPKLAKEVSVHRIDRNENIATRYSAADIEVAARHHIEVRG